MSAVVLFTRESLTLVDIPDKNLLQCSRPFWADSTLVCKLRKESGVLATDTG